MRSLRSVLSEATTLLCPTPSLPSAAHWRGAQCAVGRVQSYSRCHEIYSLMTRRTAVSLMATPLLRQGAQRAFDPDFGSALDAAAAVRSRSISSVELTKHVFERIDQFQPKLNAFVYQRREEALISARNADAAIARNEPSLPPFAGVPVVVKESFGVAGRPCTWGIPAFKNTRSATNSTAVQRLSDAGAIVIGATNVPLELTDGQSYNEIYGTTNNPWDLTLTPGGSSGGTAAAIAAG